MTCCERPIHSQLRYVFSKCFQHSLRPAGLEDVHKSFMYVALAAWGEGWALSSCKVVVTQVLVEQTGRAVRRVQADADRERASAVAPSAAAEESIQGLHPHSPATSLLCPVCAIATKRFLCGGYVHMLEELLEPVVADHVGTMQMRQRKATWGWAPAVPLMTWLWML